MPKKMGGTTRREREQLRQGAHWAAKLRAAGSDDAAQAAVAWDRLRAAVRALPARDQAAAWQRVARGLQNLHPEPEDSTR